MQGGGVFVFCEIRLLSDFLAVLCVGVHPGGERRFWAKSYHSLL